MRTVTLALLSLCLASSAFALSPQERAFLGPNGLSSREATITEPHVSESVVTNQGGNSGKPCDTAAIPANVMTQVSSDNAGPENGITGPWQQVATGFVTLQDSRSGAAFFTVDLYYGDQTVCGPNLSCYFHVTLGQYLHVMAGTSLQVPWVVSDTVPLNTTNQGDYMAYFLYVTSSIPLSCTDNSYFTEEHN